LSLPANNSLPVDSSIIAGSVLPIQRAEELLGTLPGVISARIVAGSSGAVDEIHILTTTDVTPKQTVRNVESALIAHLGMRVSHKKISVAMSDDPARHHRSAPADPRTSNGGSSATTLVNNAASTAKLSFASPIAAVAITPDSALSAEALLQLNGGPRRRFYFEDVEVRRSRSKGVACRVTLRKGDETFIGEADGLENERLRIELAARATLAAIAASEGERRVLALEGCKGVDAFEREFVFVGVTTRVGRETCLMTGSAEIRESPETASVLAILDATNRWLEK
jgi:hypothetical protein